MAKNDFFVIAYRILAYMYQCMKDGEDPNLDDVSFEKMDIPEKYWIKVLQNLLDEGYVRGISINYGLGRSIYITEHDSQITIAGIQFLQENSAMSRAKAFLKEMKEIIPGL